MAAFLDTLVNAIALGSLYALIALGYTMVYGTLKFINFAHSSVFMVGAWLSFMATRWLGWNAPGTVLPLYAPLVVMAIAMVGCAVLGWLIEFLAYRPMRTAPRLNVLITAIGVALFLENLAAHKAVFGTSPQPMAKLLPDVILFHIAATPIRLVDAVILGLALVMMGAMDFVVFHTRVGAAMRAVSQDMRTAALMGIPVNRVISMTFVAGSALAAAAGFLFVMKYPLVQAPAHLSWTMLGLKAFVAAVVGGIGNIRGAMVGGLIIAFVELFGATYVNSNYRDLFVFGILIALLLFKPTGLFGRAAIEKV